MEITPDLLQEAIKRLHPLHRKLSKPQPGEWLFEHNEPGQTFSQYLESKPVIPCGQRKVIYIQPLGNFTQTRQQVVDLTINFMKSYFNLPVRVRDGLPLSIIPAKARRIHPLWRIPQILSTYILDAVLIPRLTEDAAATIALTASDLWPGMGWNFVFGQASTRDRVGVWSIYRNGDPDLSDTDFHLCLRRTMNTAIHEVSHMFSLLHCTLYHCVMCGSNHRQESDTRPLTLCPECLAKLCWATQTTPSQHYNSLMDFFTKNGFTAETQFCRESLQALNKTYTG